jgi:hypothetical protein
MNDFIKWLSLCFAVLMLTVGLIAMTHRIEKLEEEIKAIPLPCRTMKSLLENRPIPAIHSYSRPARVCEEHQ